MNKIGALVQVNNSIIFSGRAPGGFIFLTG